MKVYGINGSPRKNNNTAVLLKKALEGVKSSTPDVETEIINLYDLKFTGCKSCFACKLLDGKSYGKCAVRDDLYEVLEKLSTADGIIFGSPIYFGDVTGELRSFLERLLFPYLVYDKNHTSIAPKKMPTAFIYTMNVPEEMMESIGYLHTFTSLETTIGMILTTPLSLSSNNTYQFNDYSKYKMELFSEEEKRKHREKQFPIDLENAFSMGAKLLNQ
ncbi:MAG: flavodoxin family protein [Clostridium perfringens]|nr:flavodoxin family protein [Clostridium perfringens]